MAERMAVLMAAKRAVCSVELMVARKVVWMVQTSSVASMVGMKVDKMDVTKVAY